MKRASALILTLALGLLVGSRPTLVASTSPVQSSLGRPLATTTDAQNLELVGHIGGTSYAVFTQGDYAYVAMGTELAILDVSASTHPVRVG